MLATYPNAETHAREWTPARGMMKSFVAGTAAALGLSLVMYALAYAAPYVTLNFLLRTALAFAVV